MVGTPDREQHPSFRRRVDLDAKVTFGKTVGHIIRAFRIFTDGYGNFIIEPFIIAFIGNQIGKMDGRASSAPVEAVVYIVLYKAGIQSLTFSIEGNGFQISVIAVYSMNTLECNPVIACPQWHFSHLQQPQDRKSTR